MKIIDPETFIRNGGFHSPATSRWAKSEAKTSEEERREHRRVLERKEALQELERLFRKV